MQGSALGTFLIVVYGGSLAETEEKLQRRVVERQEALEREDLKEKENSTEVIVCMHTRS